MVMLSRLAIASGLAGLLLSFSEASAVQVRIDFTGQAFTTPFPPIPTGPYPATGSVTFDTDLGTLTRDVAGVYTFTAMDPQAPFSVFSASLHYDMGIYSGDKFGGLGGGGFAGYFAQFQFSKSDVTALNVHGTNGAGQSIYLTSTFGFIQYGGTCGSYCATFTVETVTVHDDELDGVLAVPGPIAGAGLPGLILGVAGFIGWRRSRRDLPVQFCAGVK
jgi:hypothetical protein